MPLLNYDEKTTVLLADIKANASAVYKERIPDATQDNLALVGDAIFNYEETRNGYAKALIDRISFQIVKNGSAINALAMFKKGMANKMGKDKMETFVDLIKAQVFDPTKSSEEEFKRNLPNVLTVFHTRNRQDKYKVTVEEYRLRAAFDSEQGMSQLIEYIINSMYESDAQDEFLLMKNLFVVASTTGRVAVETITPVTDKTSAENALVKIKEVSTKMSFLTQAYNYANVNKRCPVTDQVLLMSPLFDAVTSTTILAQMFNIDIGQAQMMKVVLDDFGGLTNVEAILCSKDWMMVWDDLMETRTTYIGDGLYYNTWFHHWQTLSSSPFEPIVIFRSQAPTLTEINLIPETVTVQKGGHVQFNVEPVTATNNPSVKCTYAHDGTSDLTYVNVLGLLIVGSDETTSPITVTATSVFNPLVSDTATVTVI